VLSADSVFSQDWIEARRASASVLLDECLDMASRHTRGMDVGMEFGFAEGVQRAKGRYDILYGFNGNNEFMEVDTRLSPVLSQILRCKRMLLFNGLLHSNPGSNEQLWHADGEHLFPGSGHSYLPVHSLNVFVPLVDITEDNGGTEFFLGSHRLTGACENIVWQDANHRENIGCTGKPVAFTCRAGSAILFDYRILHRGLANTSPEPRPVLYFTYARAWFRDMHNFPSRPLLDEAAQTQDATTALQPDAHATRCAGSSVAATTMLAGGTRRAFHLNHSCSASSSTPRSRLSTLTRHPLNFLMPNLRCAHQSCTVKPLRIVQSRPSATHPHTAIRREFVGGRAWERRGVAIHVSRPHGAACVSVSGSSGSRSMCMLGSGFAEAELKAIRSQFPVFV